MRRIGPVICLTLLAACNGQGGLTGYERSLLNGFALGPVPADPTNAVADDPAAAQIGQQFYFDARFSGPLTIGSDGANGAAGPAGMPGTISCSSCHDPGRGGADVRSRPNNTSLGASWTGRHAPSVYNAAYSPWQFWDGRRDSLWAQALGPVESGAEHNFSRLEVAHLIFDRYRGPYQQIFGPMPDLSDQVRFPLKGKPGDASWTAMSAADQDAVNRVFSNFGKAIAAYERKLVDRDSAFDRFLAGDEGALSPAAARGARLFVGRASCNECHSGPTLSDGRFHNLGVPQVGPTVPAEDDGRIYGIAKLLADPFNGAGGYSDAPQASRLGALPGPGADLEPMRGAFKTPGLRGVARTAPYMHTGSLATLREVVLFYRAGGGASGFVGTKEITLQPLALSDQDVDDLVAFLESLSGTALPPALTAAPSLP